MPAIEMNGIRNGAKKNGEKTPKLLGVATILKKNNSGEWKRRDLSVKTLIEEATAEPDFPLVFLPGAEEISDHADGPWLREQLSQKFHIPPFFWKKVAYRASGFYGSDVISLGEQGTSYHRSFFRFLVKRPADVRYTKHVWHHLGFVTTQISTTSSLCVCFDVPPILLQEFADTLQLKGIKAQQSDPFAMHPIIVEQVVEFFDKSVWEWRDPVREFEEERPTMQNPDPKYAKKHEIERHVIHSTETLAMALVTLESLIEDLDDFNSPADLNDLNEPNDPNDPNDPENIKRQNRQKQQKRYRKSRKELLYQKSLLKCSHLRSEALGARLRNEINLAFNVVAQADTRVSLGISESMQADSAVMRSIAILGLLFLPGTFVSGLFGMSFFALSFSNGGNDTRWHTSDQFWIYWVVTIPATLLAFAIWYAGIRHQKRKAEQESRRRPQSLSSFRSK